MLTDIQISSLESVSESFGGVRKMALLCYQYLKEFRELRSENWKVKLSEIERLNPAAYSRVLSSLPLEKASELIEFASQYKGQPLPEIQRASTLSEAKVIAAAKGAGTIVKP